MPQPIPQEHALRRFFQTLTERSFLEQLGWPDWLVISYLSNLLTEYVHTDRLSPVHDSTGRQLSELIDLLGEAEYRAQHGSVERECDVHRQIGDYTLFMIALFPEGIRNARRRVITGHSDALVDYVKAGKRSYRIAAESEPATPADGDSGRPPSHLFRRLSAHFELCVLGLGYVKQELQQLQEPHDGWMRRHFLN